MLHDNITTNQADSDEKVSWESAILHLQGVDPRDFNQHQPDVVNSTIKWFEAAADSLQSDDVFADNKVATLAMEAARIQIGETNTTRLVDIIATKRGVGGGRAAVRKVFADHTKAQKQRSGKDMTTGADWDKIKFDQYGRAESSVHNARAGMRALGIDFAYDKFTRKCRAIHEWEGETTVVGAELRATIARKLSLEYAIEVTDDKISSAIDQMAAGNRYDSLIDAMNALPAWDEQERLDRWLIDFAGVEDNIYHREAGHVWLLAAVSRAYIPGVKFDSAIILQGDQGSGKSTLLAILAGGDLFTDDNIMSKANDSKHLIETTIGKWIVELGELAGMHRATIEDVKAMISRREDSARMAYGRSTEHYPRRMVFAGTTNSKRYLRDETGNRRFWPIITGKIDLAGLAANRDQLLAEAKVRFFEVQDALVRSMSGEIVTPYPLQLNDQESRDMAIRAQVEAFDLDEGWLDILRVLPEWLVYERGGVYYVPTNRIYQALGMSEKDWTIIAAKRVKPIMESLGWVMTANQVYFDAHGSSSKAKCWTRTDPPQTRQSPNRYI